jgi:transcriptional regulator with XRE-family HTH domain
VSRASSAGRAPLDNNWISDLAPDLCICDLAPDASQVEKSLHSDDYRRLCRMLKARRVYVGLRQVELADRLATSQSFVSDYERGERRLDLVELDHICTALEWSLLELVSDFKRA